eukprot:c9575_g1_i1.p1 GENE.c9575_g1_i1~~c9575_g1_i1.p1  ORF type:complete len:195 (-),score=35.83 c9575_g1_i1:866-1417(-)
MSNSRTILSCVCAASLINLAVKFASNLTTNLVVNESPVFVWTDKRGAATGLSDRLRTLLEGAPRTSNDQLIDHKAIIGYVCDEVRAERFLEPSLIRPSQVTFASMVTAEMASFGAVEVLSRLLGSQKSPSVVFVDIDILPEAQTWLKSVGPNGAHTQLIPVPPKFLIQFWGPRFVQDLDKLAQ